MSTEIDENDYSLQTKKQRIGRKRECCWLCKTAYKPHEMGKISIKKGSRLVSKCMKKTLPDLPTKIENERKNYYSWVPGINPVQVDHYDFYSDVLNISVLNNYQREIVCKTMQILKKNKENNTVSSIYNVYCDDNLRKIVKRCDKNQHKQMARRDL